MVADLQGKTYRVFVMMSLSFVFLSACQPKEETMDMTELTEFATRYATAWSSQDPAAFASFYVMPRMGH